MNKDEYITHLRSLRFAAATLSGCFIDPHFGMSYWTAAQRLEPTAGSSFVWRVKSADLNSENVSAMTYQLWDSDSGELSHFGDFWSCMQLATAVSYKWHDHFCVADSCAVCEVYINECSVNNGGCSYLATCAIIAGSVTCTCIPGFIGDGVSCSGKSESK